MCEGAADGLLGLMSCAINVMLQVSSFCGRATLSPCSQHHSLTLLSVSSGRQQECFLLLLLRGLFHSSMVSVTRVNVFYTVAELFFLCDMLPRKCILTPGSCEMHRSACLLPHSFPPSPNLPFHSFYCQSQTLNVCGHLLHDFPSSFLYRGFMTTIKSVLHVLQPTHTHTAL